MVTKPKKKIKKKIPEKAPDKAPAKGKKKHPGGENLKPPWKPGESGNLKGKSKGPHLKTKLLKWMAHVDEKTGMPLEDLYMKGGVIHAIKGNGPIWREIFNRIDGKVEENINIRGVNPVADAISEMDNNKLGKHIKELEVWRKKLKR